jgi:hypothetical protein
MTITITQAALAVANNLSDVANAGSARANLHVPELTPAAAVAVANVSLSAPGATVDGYSLTSGDILLLTGQTTSSQNGPWVWTGASTALTRPTEFPSAATTKGRLCAVINGSINAHTEWMLAAPTGGIVIDTGAQTWTQISTISLPLSVLTPTAVQTANYVAAAGQLVLVNNGGGGNLVMTLPTTPADQAQVGVMIAGGFYPNPLTVVAGGSDRFSENGVTFTTWSVLAGSGPAAVWQYSASAGLWYQVAGPSRTWCNVVDFGAIGNARGAMPSARAIASWRSTVGATAPCSQYDTRDWSTPMALASRCWLRPLTSRCSLMACPHVFLTLTATIPGS